MTNVKKMKYLKSWAERQSDFLSMIQKRGFEDVIEDSGETYQDWLEAEFDLLLGLILNDDTSELVSLVDGD